MPRVAAGGAICPALTGAFSWACWASLSALNTARCLAVTAVKLPARPDAHPARLVSGAGRARSVALDSGCARLRCRKGEAGREPRRAGAGAGWSRRGATSRSRCSMAVAWLRRAVGAWRVSAFTATRRRRVRPEGPHSLRAWAGRKRSCSTSSGAPATRELGRSLIVVSEPLEAWPARQTLTVVKVVACGSGPSARRPLGRRGAPARSGHGFTLRLLPGNAALVCRWSHGLGVHDLADVRNRVVPLHDGSLLDCIGCKHVS